MAKFTIFSDILKQGEQAGLTPAKTKASREWFRNKAGEIRRVNPNPLMKEADRMSSRLMVGQMYLFSYSPKTKNDLPFYDRLPLVFPFRRTADSFYGINLHYLPYAYRARLMDALYSLTSDRNYNENTKLKLSYGILNAASRYRFFKPCVKQYLNSHVQSRFINIFANEWDMALFLPLERFEKATKQQVFKESIKQFQR